MARIWGTLSLGLFAAGKYGAPTPTGADTSTVVTGLFYGGGPTGLYSEEVFYRKVERSLALHRRGEARSDGLRLSFARTILQIEWCAREIHPWDRDLPLDELERRFSTQCLYDTHAAISRLFAQIPAVDTIELCVRREPSQPPLLAGTVDREDFRHGDYSSIGMRLRSLGLKFRMSDLRLEQTSAD